MFVQHLKPPWSQLQGRRVPGGEGRKGKKGREGGRREEGRKEPLQSRERRSGVLAASTPRRPWKPLMKWAPTAPEESDLHSLVGAGVYIPCRGNLGSYFGCQCKVINSPGCAPSTKATLELGELLSYRRVPQEQQISQVPLCVPSSTHLPTSRASNRPT